MTDVVRKANTGSLGVSVERFMDQYSRTYEIRWSDLDANGHVNYAAYIDAAGDLRYRFFIEHDFPPEKFVELGIGPVYTAIHAQFFREVRMGEIITITYLAAGLSRQGGRWKVHHDVFKSNGKKAVTIDLKERSEPIHALPALPNPELFQILNQISHRLQNTVRSALEVIMKYFVTGATASLGRVVQQLTELCGGAGSTKGRDLKTLGVQLFKGDVTDKESMRPPCREWTGSFISQAGIRSAHATRRTAKESTCRGRNVLELMKELRIRKGVHCCTLAVHSDTLIDACG
jgi:acyl-CoA thioester hydrolase